MNRRDFIRRTGGAIALPISHVKQAGVNINDCTIVIAEHATARELKAARILAEEVQKRSQLSWQIQSKSSATNKIVLRTAASHGATTPNSNLEGERGADAYVISTKLVGEGRTITIDGASERGLIFGVGKLLRTLSLQRRQAGLEVNALDGSYKPEYSLRGHQLGYRPKTNSYDGWDVPDWEQYIRDLTVFGTNAIELIPPRSDDARDSPHFPAPPDQMMAAMSRICDEHGLQVWIWFPAMDPDYADAATVASALKEWETIFKLLPRIDALFVPGGDPGHTQPGPMLAFLEKQKASLRQHHPKAQMWMSPQGFRETWLEEFFTLIEGAQVQRWLDGVVFGPQSRLSLPEFRKRVPSRYPIRLYPDITHSLSCQFPVPNWDAAYALTEGREVINPRPKDQANILKKYLPSTIGFITYSEGCNDDVNKFVWSCLGWNSKQSTASVLKEFCGYFFGGTVTEGMTQGLQNLEDNWRGPLLTNGQVEITLAKFRELELSASPQLLRNWRFQQALYRAYYDAAVCRRLKRETGALQEAYDSLGRTQQIGWGEQPIDIEEQPSRAPVNGLDVNALLAEVERVLDNALLDHKEFAATTRVRELAEALFQSVHMQLAVTRYRGEAVSRGANLETFEYPVTDIRWLKAQIETIQKLNSSAEQLTAIRQVLRRTDPGPTGFYDEPGNPNNRPHVVGGAHYLDDPEFRSSVLTGFDYPDTRGAATPLAWKRWGETLFDTPFRMHYSQLDDNARYRVRVVYSGESRKIKIRLVAGEEVVHDFIERPTPQKPLEFDIPDGAIQDGELNLTWSREPGLGGNGRGCQICEVWLLRA
jgi:hypothetical protein